MCFLWFLVGLVHTLSCCVHSLDPKYCDSYRGCIGDSVLLGSGVYCRSFESCLNATNITSVGSDIYCSSDESCQSSESIVSDSNVFCYGTLSCSYVDYLYSSNIAFCYGAQACENAVNIYAENHIWCTGTYSCHNVMESMIAYAGYAECSGLNSCKNTKRLIANTYVLCIGEFSCHNVSELIAVNDFVACKARYACSHAYLGGTGYVGPVSCSGEYACNEAIINNSLNIEAYGYYSLYQAIIYANGRYVTGHGTSGNEITYSSQSSLHDVSVYLYGYYSGWGATIICQNGITCKIYCRGNGCENTNLVIENNSTFIVHCKSDVASSCPNDYKDSNVSIISLQPTLKPSNDPTDIPIVWPSAIPSVIPSGAPTGVVSDLPSVSPTNGSEAIIATIGIMNNTSGQTTITPQATITTTRASSTMMTTETNTNSGCQDNESSNSDSSNSNNNDLFNNILFFPFIIVSLICLVLGFLCVKMFYNLQKRYDNNNNGANNSNNSKDNNNNNNDNNEKQESLVNGDHLTKVQKTNLTHQISLTSEKNVTKNGSTLIASSENSGDEAGHKADIQLVSVNNNEEYEDEYKNEREITGANKEQLGSPKEEMEDSQDNDNANDESLYEDERGAGTQGRYETEGNTLGEDDNDKEEEGAASHTTK